ncbi:MAG: hypothetical protein Ct9H300mP27_02220 [Chloroflexota bacterium]|nr:MAG: hypothetical protein Ct9H300mP27_02220 [Chloroflexota bacterium]
MAIRGQEIVSLIKRQMKNLEVILPGRCRYRSTSRGWGRECTRATGS